jgi:hypothetical protein
MQEQYLLAYALIGALVFLGYLVVGIPRPRRKAYATEEAERDAVRAMEVDKQRAKKAKQSAKRRKVRDKAKKKKKSKR